MKYRSLGKTGLQVSEIGFGGWAIGGTSYGSTKDEDSLAALEDWMNNQGVKNITALNVVLEKSATPWYEAYGGKGKVETIERPALCCA